MATSAEYDRVLAKAEGIGLGSLNKQEMEIMKKMSRESGSRGNRARRIIDGK